MASHSVTANRASRPADTRSRMTALYPLAQSRFPTTAGVTAPEAIRRSVAVEFASNLSAMEGPASAGLSCDGRWGGFLHLDRPAVPGGGAA